MHRSTIDEGDGDDFACIPREGPRRASKIPPIFHPPARYFPRTAGFKPTPVPMTNARPVFPPGNLLGFAFDRALWIPTISLAFEDKREITRGIKIGGNLNFTSIRAD